MYELEKNRNTQLSISNDLNDINNDKKLFKNIDIDFKYNKDIQNIIGKIVKLDEKEYLIMPSENKREVCVSLQNISTGLYLRHQNDRIIETNKNQNPTNFIAESSFIPESRGDGFVLRCINQGFEDSYICKLDVNTYIVSEDLVEFVFYAFAYSTYMENNFAGNNTDVHQQNNMIFGCMLCINNVNCLVVPPNDSNEDHISLLNISNRCYALVSGKQIVNEFVEHGDNFKNDSSFVAEVKNKNIILHCTNKDNQNLSIVYSKKEEEFIAGDRDQVFVFSKIYSFKQWDNIKMILANF